MNLKVLHARGFPFHGRKMDEYTWPWRSGNLLAVWPNSACATRDSNRWRGFFSVAQKCWNFLLLTISNLVWDWKNCREPTAGDAWFTVETRKSHESKPLCVESFHRRKFADSLIHTQDVPILSRTASNTRGRVESTWLNNSTYALTQDTIEEVWILFEGNAPSNRYKWDIMSISWKNFAAWPHFRWRRQSISTRVVMIHHLPICLVSILFKSLTTQFNWETLLNLIKFDTFLIPFDFIAYHYYQSIAAMTMKVKCIHRWPSEQVFPGKTIPTSTSPIHWRHNFDLAHQSGHVQYCFVWSGARSRTLCLETLNFRRVLNLLPNRVRNILLLCKSWFRMHFDFPINKKPATNSARAYEEEKRKSNFISLPQSNECSVWRMKLASLASHAIRNVSTLRRLGATTPLFNLYIRRFVSWSWYICWLILWRTFKLFIQQDCNLIHSSESRLRWFCSSRLKNW